MLKSRFYRNRANRKFGKLKREVLVGKREMTETLSKESFEARFADWKQRAESLDRQLRPILHAEIDINAPDYRQQLKKNLHPADESGLREEITSFFNEVVDSFEHLEAEQRRRLIDLMDRNSSLMYSAVIDGDYETVEGFRKHMILMVIEDQGKDTRDAMVALAHYRRDGEEFGFDVDGIFREMADIADTRDKYGWGSTRNLVLNH